MPDAPTLQIDRAEAANELASVLTSGISLLSADYHAALMAGGRPFSGGAKADLFDKIEEDIEAEMEPQKVGRIAVIGIHGPTMQRGGWLAALFGLTSYDSILAQVQQAEDDPTIGGTILHVDSPGGDAFGAFEAAAQLASMRKKKMYAVVEGIGASAAYALLSAADRVFVAPSSITGSVGVIWTHVDASGALSQAGLKPTPIYAGDHKIDGSPDAPLSDPARAEMKAKVDGLYQQFVRVVAKNRGLSQRAVVDTQARTYLGADAVAVGLADEVGTLADAVSALRAKIGRSSSSSAPRGTASKPSAPTGAEGNQMQTAAFLAALGLANETDEAKVLASLTTIKAQAAETGTLRAQADQTKGQLDMAQRALAAMEAEKATLTADKAALSAQVATLTEEKRTLQAAQEVATWQAALDAEGVKADAEGTKPEDAIRPRMLAQAQATRKEGQTPAQAVAALKADPFYKFGFEPAAPPKPARTEAAGKVLAMAGRVGTLTPVAVADDAEKLISIL